MLQSAAMDGARPFETARMRVVVGDLTRVEAEGLVNAASPSLLGGAGVDGALHHAAGPRLLAHNRGLGGCPTGDARLTPAFDLEARGVRALIHAVGPVWGSDPDARGDEPLGYRLEDHQLARCYVTALELAAEAGLSSLAFPAISTGAYGFPKARAARIAVGHVRHVLGRLARPREVIFCCFDAHDAELYRRELDPARFLQGIEGLVGLGRRG